VNLPSHPLFDMLPSEVKELAADHEGEGSRFRKGQPPKEQGQPIDVDDLIARSMEDGKTSAWGRPGAYEVP